MSVGGPFPGQSLRSRCPNHEVSRREGGGGRGDQSKYAKPVRIQGDGAYGIRSVCSLQKWRFAPTAQKVNSFGTCARMRPYRFHFVNLHTFFFHLLHITRFFKICINKGRRREVQSRKRQKMREREVRI